ncbi:hypothetical protein F5148DRAFT_269890 [Russula earlei]|uniref:Uncharacterized protein n=2 Tax=Russula earlei TaxID=71964 RepID=A0ACC0U2Y2_9AGAM|nr:hypothetical protein F5148DRAFT_784529 [Russula earlei]KAI9460265.1 hypothetical protein F5148DRAFT_269890 [Russula earlei]
MGTRGSGFTTTTFRFVFMSSDTTSLIPAVEDPKISNTGKSIARLHKKLRLEEPEGRIEAQLYRNVTIERLYDDVLLEIFDFYIYGTRGYDGWHILVHICRRWRNVVFASPRRLNLQLVCTQGRPVEKTLDLWPALPIIIQDDEKRSTRKGAKNIMAALKCRHRIRQIALRVVPALLSEGFAAVMQKRFPALKVLTLVLARGAPTPIFPPKFLGGYTPRLRAFSAEGISFPALPRLLLSARHLVHLSLWDIPRSGYISPEAMVACLSTLSKLEILGLMFKFPRVRPNRAIRRPAPLTRSVLPALTTFEFKGVNEYLEYLVARIDAPLLHKITITFFNQLIFDNSQLARFLNCAEEFKAFDHAEIFFSTRTVDVQLSRQTNLKADYRDHARFELTISCREPEWQLSSLAQVCNSSLSLFAALERLDIHGGSPQRWQDDMESAQWLELLHPFTTVKDLHLHQKLSLYVMHALQDLSGQSVTEVLPALQNIFLGSKRPSEPVRKAIGEFVTARQLSGHPVAVHR